jgi:hypothetical protein
MIIVRAFFLDQVAGSVPLGMQRVQGDDDPGQVQAVQQRPYLGDLVGFVPDLALSDDRPAAGHRRQQVHRPAVGLDRAADRLAVHRDRGRPVFPGALAGLRC